MSCDKQKFIICRFENVSVLMANIVFLKKIYSFICFREGERAHVIMGVETERWEEKS